MSNTASVCDGLKYMIDNGVISALFNFTMGTTMIGKQDLSGKQSYVFNYCPMCGKPTDRGVPQCL